MELGGSTEHSFDNPIRGILSLSVGLPDCRAVHA